MGNHVGIQSQPAKITFTREPIVANTLSSQTACFNGMSTSVVPVQRRVPDFLMTDEVPGKSCRERDTRSEVQGCYNLRLMDSAGRPIKEIVESPQISDARLKLGQKVEERSTHKMELERAELNRMNESDMEALCPDVALIGRYRNGKSRDEDPGSPSIARRHLCLKKEIMKHAGISGIYQLHTQWVRVDDKSLKTDVRQPGNDMVTGKMRHAQLDREQCWESSLAPGSPSSLTYLQRIQDYSSASMQQGLEIRSARASLNRVARPVYLEMDDLSDAASLISGQSVDVLMPER